MTMKVRAIHIPSYTISGVLKRSIAIGNECSLSDEEKNIFTDFVYGN